MSILDRLTNTQKLAAIIQDVENGSDQINPEELALKMKERVKGQDHVIDPLCKIIATRMMQTRGGRPLVSILLSGPSSTGKSELAKALTEVLFDNEESMIMIACGDLATHDIAGLVGSQQGYQGGEGLLTKKIKATPKTLVLFDEVEKPIPTKDAPLAKMLLGMLGEGRIQDQRTGESVDCSNVIVFMTSNAEQDEMRRIAKLYEGKPAEMLTQCKAALENKPFAPELLKRIDMVSTTKALSNELKSELAAVKMDKIVKKFSPLEIAGNGLDVEVFIPILKWLSNDKNTFREFDAWFENRANESIAKAKSCGAKSISLSYDKTNDLFVATPVSYREGFAP